MSKPLGEPLDLSVPGAVELKEGDPGYRKQLSDETKKQLAGIDKQTVAAPRFPYVEWKGKRHR